MLLFLISASPALAASTNGDISLTPPPGFVRATAFDGYVHPQYHASIEIRELEAPIDDLLEQFSPELFEQRGFEVRHIQRSEVDGRATLVYFVAAPDGQPAVDQWQLLMGDDFSSISIAASFPRIHAGTLSQTLGETLASVRWSRTREQQLFRGLPFTVRETPDLRFVKRSANSIVLAGTELPEKSIAMPFITISHVQSESDLGGSQSLSIAHLEKVDGLQVEEILEESDTRVDGIPAYRITARAHLRGRPNPVMFQQIIANQPRKYLLVHGVVDATMAERFLPQFESVVASIQFKTPQ